MTKQRILSFEVEKRWYVLANRTGAVIYTDKPQSKFSFVERLSNPKGQYTESQLDSDRPGKSFSSAARGAFQHPLDRRSKSHEHVAISFAKKITNTLAEAKQSGRFTELVLVAEPHFLGLLRKALPVSLKRVVKHEIAHEYAEGSDAELHDHVLQAMKLK